mgnify:CR=1 FL=1
MHIFNPERISDFISDIKQEKRRIDKQKAEEERKEELAKNEKKKGKNHE